MILIDRPVHNYYQVDEWWRDDFQNTWGVVTKALYPFHIDNFH